MQVAAEEEAEAAAEAALEDPEARAAALEAQRRREAEEWRLQQLRTGAADANSNFAPVMGDWRQQIQQRRGGRGVAAEAAATAASQVDTEAAEASAGGGDGGTADAADGDAGGVPDLDALSEGLPGGWRAMWSDAHQRLYYGHLHSKASSVHRWEEQGPRPLTGTRPLLQHGAVPAALPAAMRVARSLCPPVQLAGPAARLPGALCRLARGSQGPWVHPRAVVIGWGWVLHAPCVQGRGPLPR